MSGLDAFQAATSAFALAELARQTALLIRRVCKAHKDAEELYQKTQNLFKLVESVHRVLRTRQQRRDGSGTTEGDQETERSIVSSLDLCSKCLRGIHAKFEALLDPNQSKKSLRARIKFVLRQDYVASQERNISMHLSTLSVLLQCLLHEDQADQRVNDYAERQNRQQWTQNQQDIHETFLRQLFALFQYVFHHAAAASDISGVQPPSSTTRSEHIGPREHPSIGNDDAQTLDDLFGPPNNRRNSFDDFTFANSVRIEEVVEDTVQAEGNSLQDTEQDLVLEEIDAEDIAGLERSRSLDVVQYAGETTFILAIKQGSSNLVRNLINEGADLTAKDSYDWTFLHHAVFRLKEEIVDILLEQTPCQQPENLNAQTKTGETALIFAVQRANKQEGYNIAMKLMKFKCDINIDDGKGSALYYAVAQGKPSRPRQSLVKSMAENGADVPAVQRQTPENVSNYLALSQYISTMDDQRDSKGTQDQRDNNAVDVTERRESTARRESATRRDSTSTKQSTIKRILSRTKSRTISDAGPAT